MIELGDKIILLKIVSDMEDLINKLIASGRITRDSVEYKTLDAIYKRNENLTIKENNSIEDLIKFYHNYQISKEIYDACMKEVF